MDKNKYIISFPVHIALNRYLKFFLLRYDAENRDDSFPCQMQVRIFHYLNIYIHIFYLVNSL